jgi:tetratricopeptide (TPR) repeat protein
MHWRMDNSELNTEKLIQYMDGDLTGADLDNFEKRLSQDSSLQQELESLTLAKMAIRSYGLKHQVSSMHREILNELKSTQKREAKIYSIVRSSLKYAASIALVLFSIGAYLYLSSSSNKLYDDNFMPYTLSVTRGEAIGSDLEKAFNQKHYNAVISAFTKLKNPDDKEYFLAGHAYLSTHQASSAISAFKQVLLSSGSNIRFKEDAEYYLGLAYLENNQPAKAASLFEKIHNEKDHLYHDKISFWTRLKLKLLVLKTSGK